MPKELITQSELNELKLQYKPSFVPLTEENVVKVFDTETGIAQRRLSNGISINYKVICSSVCLLLFFSGYKNLHITCLLHVVHVLYGLTESWFMISQITQNEARVGVMRLIVGGGRATEDSESKGSVIVGVRTLSEGGCVGNFSREQVKYILLMGSNFYDVVVHPFIYYLHNTKAITSSRKK